MRSIIHDESSTVGTSLWNATANDDTVYPALTGEAEADVAIVGGGFTGLSAALHLAEAGVPVVVLEAQSPGWGASGRNGGQVIPGLKEDPDDIEERFGPEQGARMVALAGGAPDLVFSLIERHGLDCGAVRKGWIQPAHDAAGLKVSHRRAEQWARRGAPVEVLDRERTTALLGTESYLGGLIDRRGGGVHPLNYALGLARAATELGARIHGGSRVVSRERAAEGFILRTEKGTVRAGKVLICVNGYADGLEDRLRRSVVPVRSAQVATRPLSENVRRSILPEGHVASDTRRALLYFRLDAEGRLLMGGRGGYSDAAMRDRQSDLRKIAEEVFPQIGEADWAFHWGGYVAITPDHYPHLHEIEPGCMAALGYNGRGVAMATAMGQVLSRWAESPALEVADFPVTGIRPIPFHQFRKPAVAAVGLFYRLRDRMGL